MGTYTREPHCDEMIKKELLSIRERVTEKDRDFVAVYDGEEGVGKSVLAFQHAVIADPDFSIENVVFTSDRFIEKIRDPKTKKGTCIVLDEAFNAANARASLTEVNRAMIALATEMRQKNLIVFLVLPTFFDLDKYFALWRTRVLIHVYFTPQEERRYIVFDRQAKKLLYLAGKKKYDYSYPKASFPPCNFYNQYTIPETDYRKKKAEAFKSRTVSNQARNWLLQRNALTKYLIRDLGYTHELVNDTLKQFNAHPLSPAQLTFISKELTREAGGIGEMQE
ncbi:MAG: hypothetical protein QME12_08695 [Nanoarchaeota archaeon]|nr:hypothetical protein [Nanoarchaeota archaeon]